MVHVVLGRSFSPKKSICRTVLVAYIGINTIVAGSALNKKLNCENWDSTLIA
jgi:hypothetical protein